MKYNLLSQKEFQFMLGTNSDIILFIHGFLSDKHYLMNKFLALHDLGYTLVARNNIGHGGRQGSVFSWHLMIKEYMDFIDNLEKPIIVIGHSLGGTIAINLAKNKNVRKVFSISTFYDLESISKTLYQKIKRYIRKLFGSFDEKQIEPYFVKNLKLTKEETSKIYLVHGKHDNTIGIENVFKIQKKLHISKNRCLITNDYHIITLSRKKIEQFIITHLSN